MTTLPIFPRVDLGRHPAGPAPVVRLDSGLTVGLLPCDWERADWRMPLWATGVDIAVNVNITGRKPQRWCDSLWMRARITFVGDCEPDTATGGWVRLT